MFQYDSWTYFVKCMILLGYGVGRSNTKFLSTLPDEQVHMLAAADRFMWDMSRIPRYEQRLNSLVFKRKVPGRILCSARLWSTPLRINFALSHSETEPVERSSVQSLNFASTLMTQFSERLAFVQPRIESVLNASTEITASKGLRCLLELVLALGTTPYARNDHRTKEKPQIDRLR